MEQKKKPFNKGGRKPKLDPRTHRYSLNLDDVENAKFLAFYDQSGYKVKAHFIKNCIFGKSFKVLRIVELVKTNQQIIALTKQFEASYKEEGIISAEK